MAADAADERTERGAVNAADFAPRTFAFVQIDATTTDPAELARIAPGLQAQLREDLAPAWGVGNGDTVSGTLYAQAAPQATGAIPMYLRAQAPADEEGALALHRDDAGLAIDIFEDLIAQYGVTLSSAVSHELLELSADPECDRTATLPDGRVAAVEICDQVEALSYSKLGVDVSDFNLPSNFGIGGNDPPYDAMNRQTSQFQVLDGGYAQVLGPDGWQQLGGMRAYRAELDRRGLSRGARRRRRHALLR